MNDSHGQPRVVVVGGGFAGLFAARALRRAPVQVTLIDSRQHHLFQPLLYQCATGILSEGKIAAPLRDVLRKHQNVDCELAEVTGIDLERRVVIARRPLQGRVEFGYDHLILAAGVLTFALVGAGPTGVELAGQIRELATKTLRGEYRHIKPEEARVLLFDGGDAPLASFGPALSAKAGKTLDKLGVEQHMHSIVTQVDATGLNVRNADGETDRYDAGTVLWTAGVAAPPLATAVAEATGAEQDRAGRIAVGKDLSIPGHPEIMVVGDVMSLDKLPGVAEVAMQSGLYAGHRIHREVTGKPAAGPFKYRDLGSAAYLSRGNAVVEVGRLHFSGFPGWVVWLFIHVAFLTGYRNRLSAVMTWWLAFTRDLRRERTFTTRDVATVHAPATPAPQKQ
jgi:NADH:ubiquinone reductase (H+-translocating)